MESNQEAKLDSDVSTLTLEELKAKSRSQTVGAPKKKISIAAEFQRSQSVASKINIQKLFKRKGIKRPSTLLTELSKIEVDEVKLQKLPSTEKKFEINCSPSDLAWQDQNAGIMTPECFLKIVRATFSLTEQMMVELTVCFRAMRRERLGDAEYYLSCYEEYKETESSISELVVQQIAVKLGVDPEFIDKNVQYYLEDQNIMSAGPEGEKVLQEFGEKIDRLPNPKKKVDTAMYHNILGFQLEKSRESAIFEPIMKLKVDDDDIISDLILLYMEDLINKQFGVEEEDYIEEVSKAISTNSKIYERTNATILQNFEKMLEELDN